MPCNYHDRNRGNTNIEIWKLIAQVLPILHSIFSFCIYPPEVWHSSLNLMLLQQMWRKSHIWGYNTWKWPKVLCIFWTSKKCLCLLSGVFLFAFLQFLLTFILIYTWFHYTEGKTKFSFYYLQYLDFWSHGSEGPETSLLFWHSHQQCTR